MAPRAIAFLITPILAALLLGGCSTDEGEQARAHLLAEETGIETDEDAFHCEVTLYRRYTGTDWLRDKDHVFTVKDESRVRARVEFVNVRPERTYAIHMVWIKPNGEESFRRYAEVRRHLVRLPAGMSPDSTGALPAATMGDLARRWGEEDAGRIARRLVDAEGEAVPVTERFYRDAEDLGDVRRRIYLDPDQEFSVWAYLNISREKERELGEWRLRIYLDRRFLRDVPFEIQENA
ncbi:hypothetical protein GF314_13130 [bacterium]|nr:hypothetical protein [bacterium]